MVLVKVGLYCLGDFWRLVVIILVWSSNKGRELVFLDDRGFVMGLVRVRYLWLVGEEGKSVFVFFCVFGVMELLSSCVKELGV